MNLDSFEYSEKQLLSIRSIQRESNIERAAVKTLTRTLKMLILNFESNNFHELNELIWDNCEL